MGNHGEPNANQKGGDAMSTGVIRRVVRDRSFGFIKSNGGLNVFFHRSQLQNVAFDSLKEGQWVKFEVGLGVKGLQALNIKLVKRDSRQFLPRVINN